jgi:hypothetical protein
MVLGVIVLVIVVVVLIVVGRGGGASSAAPTASASASARPSASAGASSSAAPSSGASASAPASPSASASATSTPVDTGAKDGATCQKAQIQLKPIVDKGSFGPTEEPKIAMSITNAGTNSCHMDLGSAQQVLTITSGSETYWTSKDCQTGGTDQDVTLKAGQTLTTPAIAWDRTRSSTTTCDSSRAAVTAGGASYHLKVAVGNISSEASAQFVLN